jgi:hypothetical protein
MRLYQWLSQRASSFRSDTSATAANHTVRTEVTVERQGTTVVIGNVPMNFDTCPLCGSKLASEQARLRLRGG